MYNFTCLSHIVDGFILPAGMQVWVVCTYTHTHLPDGYMMLSIYVPASRNIIPYPSPCRVLGFRVPIAISNIGKLTICQQTTTPTKVKEVAGTEGALMMVETHNELSSASVRTTSLFHRVVIP
jgi:hypothetical protein